MDFLGDDFIEVINSYTKEQWRPLLDLIPTIEKTEKFGEIGGGTLEKDGSFLLPYSIPGEIINRFKEVVYDIPIIISFDWGSWSHGNEIVHGENFDYNSIDIPTKCMAITTFVRADRFVDGVLVDAFEKGKILKILKSIHRQLEP